MNEQLDLWPVTLSLLIGNPGVCNEPQTPPVHGNSPFHLLPRSHFLGRCSGSRTRGPVPPEFHYDRKESASQAVSHSGSLLSVEEKVKKKRLWIHRLLRGNTYFSRPRLNSNCPAGCSSVYSKPPHSVYSRSTAVGSSVPHSQCHEKRVAGNVIYTCWNPEVMSKRPINSFTVTGRRNRKGE